jgi:serine/threonine-protein kinase RsbW
MPSNEEAEFPARLTALPDTASFARGFCERNGVGRDTALRLTFVIEELFTNTVKHGFGEESDSPVRIELAMSEGGVSVIYEDSAPRYDPTVRWSVAPPDLAAPAEERPVGGLGVYLIRQIVADARYAYEEGRNRLCLVMLFES